MKWIFALDAGSVDSYGDFVRVAVLSARKHSSLAPICLFDGDECELTQWMGEQGVEIIHVRSRLYDSIVEIATRRQMPFWLQFAPGTFLRLEIPRLARERGWNDEFVFYTDCDVMFAADPRPLLEPLRPRFFAACPETFKDKPLHLNAGVMWMNVRAMDDPAFDAWLDRNLERCCEWQYDQTACRVFYHPLHRLAWRLKVPYRLFYSLMARLPVRSWQWDDLPLELNWRPYWGENADASVIHFQGIKPTQRDEVHTDPFIARMNTPFFQESALRWDEWLQLARDGAR